MGKTLTNLQPRHIASIKRSRYAKYFNSIEHCYNVKEQSERGICVLNGLKTPCKDDFELYEQCKKEKGENMRTECREMRDKCYDCMQFVGESMRLATFVDM